jgi:hypothetical protein
MPPAALREFRQHYLPAPDHKAFAIASGGAHGWQGGAASEFDARERALARCKAAQRQGGGTCRIVDTDGDWLE